MARRAHRAHLTWRGIHDHHRAIYPGETGATRPSSRLLGRAAADEPRRRLASAAGRSHVVMITGPSAALLTVLFLATGAYCLRSWTSRGTTSTARHTIEEIVDVDHLVMSAAMILMIWWPTGWWGSLGQGAAFAALGVVLGRRALLARGSRRISLVAHSAVNAAMTWMLGLMMSMEAPPFNASTSASTSASRSASGHAGRADGTGAVGDMSGMGAMSFPDWVTPANLTVVALMVGASGWWALLAMRSRSWHCVCHAGMGLGMAAMLVLMV